MCYDWCLVVQKLFLLQLEWSVSTWCTKRQWWRFLVLLEIKPLFFQNDWNENPSSFILEDFTSYAGYTLSLERSLHLNIEGSYIIVVCRLINERSMIFVLFTINPFNISCALIRLFLAVKVNTSLYCTFVEFVYIC